MLAACVQTEAVESSGIVPGIPSDNVAQASTTFKVTINDSDDSPRLRSTCILNYSQPCGRTISSVLLHMAALWSHPGDWEKMFQSHPETFCKCKPQQQDLKISLMMTMCSRVERFWREQWTPECEADDVQAQGRKGQGQINKLQEFSGSALFSNKFYYRHSKMAGNTWFQTPLLWRGRTGVLYHTYLGAALVSLTFCFSLPFALRGTTGHH